uniref:protein VAPYRIN-LIKE-like n=1 Tax=Erigeron canadensis TaxID=72917 RepID=UPI001CB9160B|nr:protein VAPYRIN-LIKE-like [Erigeron canadensis]
MDRLVKPNVKDLSLVFTRDQKCRTTFELTNLMHTMPVVVFLDTTSPALLSFTHPFSVIPPLGTMSYTLLSQPLDHPPLSVPTANVLVQSSMLLTRKTDQESLRLVFSKRGPHIFKDATIPVSFVGPQVVEFLLSSRHSKTVDTMFFLTKSVPFCNESSLISLLKSAVLAGNSHFVTFLKNNGANVNHRSKTGESMMSLAIRSGNVDVVRAIVESTFMVDHSLDRFLHDAASMNSVDIMELLCMSYLDIDINSIDSRGQTPLHIASKHGYIEAIDFLVTLGSDPAIVDDNGWTPLHFASSEGHVLAVEFLLNSCSYVKYALTKEGKTAIALAYENDHMELYDMLYLGDVLLRAATINDVNGLKKCLAEGANVNGKDQNGWTALHRAAFKGRVESVQALLDNGARVDLVDDTGCPALHRAIDSGHAQVALLLVAGGARANTKSLIGHMVFDMDSGKSTQHSLVAPLC